MTFDTQAVSGLPNNSPGRGTVPSFDDAASQYGASASLADRALQTRIELASLGRLYQRIGMHVARLLSEVQQGDYWRGDFDTFTQYVEKEVGIRMRTAQELLKVFHAARRLHIPLDEIERLGWSKLAVVAGKLTEENKAELLRDVERLTYSQLKTKHAREATSSSRKSGSVLYLTEDIQRALRRATCFTHDEDPQHNLEFVARKFLEHCAIPSIVGRTQHSN